MNVSYVGMNSNAAYGMMQNADTMLGMCRNSSGSQDTRAMAQKEKGLQMDSLNNQLVYTATDLMEDSQKKMRNANIKRAFSYFA